MANHKTHSKYVQNKFYELIRAQGWGSFDIIKLEELECTDDDHLIAEQKWIDTLSKDLCLNSKRAKADKALTKQKQLKSAIEHYYANRDSILEKKKLYYQHNRKYNYENNYNRISKIFLKILR
jgi:hypothetical protein